MKLYLVSIGLFALVGCAHTQPVSQNYPITETSHECAGGSCRVVTRTDGREVTVRQLPSPKVQGQIVSTEVVDDNPYEEETSTPQHTWMTGEEAEKAANERLMKAIKEAVRRDSCFCHPGDPLCSCL